MTTAFDDALVESSEPHDGTFNLPDPDDDHVVAAALVGGAGAIITLNLRDFPIAKIRAHIKVLPQRICRRRGFGFTRRRAVRYPDNGLQVSRPPLTTEEILNRLVQRYRMTEAVEVIRAVT